jgi:hypothetical protein
MTTMGCMVDHIHLDKKYIQHTLPKRNNMHLFINFFLGKYCGGVPHSLKKNLNKPKGVYVQAGARGRKGEKGSYHHIKRYSPKTK